MLNICVVIFTLVQISLKAPVSRRLWEGHRSFPQSPKGWVSRGTAGRRNLAGGGGVVGAAGRAPGVQAPRVLPHLPPLGAWPKGVSRGGRAATGDSLMKSTVGRGVLWVDVKGVLLPVALRILYQRVEDSGRLLRLEDLRMSLKRYIILFSQPGSVSVTV